MRDRKSKVEGKEKKPLREFFNNQVEWWCWQTMRLEYKFKFRVSTDSSEYIVLPFSEEESGWSRWHDNKYITSFLRDDVILRLIISFC